MVPVTSRGKDTCNVWLHHQRTELLLPLHTALSVTVPTRMVDACHLPDVRLFLLQSVGFLSRCQPRIPLRHSPMRRGLLLLLLLRRRRRRVGHLVLRRAVATSRRMQEQSLLGGPLAGGVGQLAAVIATLLRRRG
eukprot:COSAG01_NODE_1723_length_9381_cov_23.828611_3_plen_135_part_00